METALQQYAKFQALVQKDAKDVAVSVYKDLGTQYNVPSVPVHSHDGADSLKVAFESLSNAPLYRVVKNVTLTSAQILSLKTSPVTILPAAGANQLIIVEHITAQLQFLTTAYTGANALEFRYTNASGAKVTADMPNTFINSSATAYEHAPAITSAFVPVANAPIVAAVPTADPATGDSVINLVVVYRVVPFNV